MKLDDSCAARAQKNQTRILVAMRETGQNRIAELIGESDSSVSRAKDELPRLCAILAACGMKVVSEEKKLVDPEFLAALQLLAKRGLAAEPDFEDTL